MNNIGGARRLCETGHYWDCFEDACGEVESRAALDDGGACRTAAFSNGWARHPQMLVRRSECVIGLAARRYFAG